jgi:hypothetical protein
MYILVRDDGAYVAPAGSRSSYTRELQHARTFATREAAERDRCPGNERVIPLEEAVSRPRP